MYRFFSLLTICLLLFTSACSDETGAPQDVKKGASYALVLSQGNNELLRKFNIELADSSEKIHHGLMGRTALDKESGMLFDINLVPRDMDIAFWMKDTLIPLDILFIDENGVIFFIHKEAKPNDTTPIYPPKRPRAVLEINGGQTDEFGISVGDILKADLLGNN